MDALIVCEDGQLTSHLRRVLRLRWPDLELNEAHSEHDARRVLAGNPPTLLLVSMASNGIDALQFIREIRGQSDVPIVAVSRRVSEGEIVDALEAGADDLVTTRISESLLIARVCAALRRAGKLVSVQRSAVKFGELTIDSESHEARLGGKAVYLTPTEFRLLYELAQHEGCLVTQRALEQAIWGSADRLYLDVLRKHVQRLRRKLESPRGRHLKITTIPRVGYKLTRSSNASSGR